MRIFGTILPWVATVISPCDENQVPAMSEDEEKGAHFETKAYVLAWLGFAMMIASGEIMPRTVDPENPRRYAAGNL